MSITICLVVYGLMVAVVGPPVLVRLTRRGIAPWLGVSAWLVAIAAVLLAWTATVVMVVGGAMPLWIRHAQWMADCFARVTGSVESRAGAVAHAGLMTVVAVVVVMFPFAVWRTGRGALRMRARSHRHARMARVIGHCMPGSDTVVVDTTDRIAYCVAGRPNTIVVTTGALAVLTPDQLQAVLAHERAHLTGRHHLVLAAVRGMAAALPRMRLFDEGAADIARLLEMCADDTAARRHGRRALLGGLLALTGTQPAPAGALGAGGHDVVVRANRLTVSISPVTHLRSRALLSVTTIAIAAIPITFGVLWTAGVLMCGPMPS